MSYLVLEGGDGSGKSMQAGLLVEWLVQQGHAVRHVREPGSTPTGEALRRLLLSSDTGALQPFTEALLFSAARAEMLRLEVGPALARGEIVIAERCYLSTWVYQGLAPDASEQPPELSFLRELTAGVHGTLWPDRIFVLDVDDDVRRQRQAGGSKDRIEAREDAYHRRVQQAYVRLARSEESVEVVDANAEVEVVQQTLRRLVTGLLAREAGR